MGSSELRMTIQNRIQNCKKKRREIEAHPMCGRLEEDSTYIWVIFPDGDFSVDGVRVRKDRGFSAAADLLLARLERFWVESLPAFYAGGPDVPEPVVTPRCACVSNAVPPNELPGPEVTEPETVRLPTISTVCASIFTGSKPSDLT